MFASVESNVEDFEIRITSIRQLNNSKAMFAGIATNDTFATDGSTLIFVDTHPDRLGGMVPEIGQHWKISGSCSKSTHKYEKHSRPVLLVDAIKAECIVPADHEALVKFISRDKDFAGINENKARKLIKAFPNDPYRSVIENNTQTLMDACGLTFKAAERLKSGFKKYHNMKYARWLANHGVHLNIVSRIIKHHDFRTIDLITENPWRLMDFGLSFDVTSDIARRILRMKDGDINEDQYKTDPRRIIAATEDAMQKIATRGGHTVATHRQIIKHLGEKHFDRNLSEAAIKLAVRFKKLICVDDGLYQLAGTYIHEAVIAKRLLKLGAIDKWDAAEEEAFRKALAKTPFLNDSQKLATQRSAMYGTTVITGGAGTGKTTVLKTVLSTYASLGYTIQGVAVAGRAAKRMNESTGCYSCTIAKYLRNESPKHGEKYVLVIDEASMLDVQTMFAIVTHLPDTARIIFVGDVQQLPSIGAGRVFADIINSNKVPITFLDKNERQEDSTGIPYYSECVINGEVPKQLSMSNITFHDVDVDEIERTVDMLVTKSDDETQIIGMTRKGWKNMAGIEQINRNAQSTLNKHGKRITVGANGHHQFDVMRENDRVIFTRNNYDKAVWNGTLGKVVNVNQRDDVYAEVNTDDGDIIEITHSMLFEMQLSYAITLHKAQGSQFKRIIITLTNKRMLDRSWLYTAITRAETHVNIIGPKDLLLQAIATKSKATQRQTRLKSMLEGDFVHLKAKDDQTLWNIA